MLRIRSIAGGLIAAWLPSLGWGLGGGEDPQIQHVDSDIPMYIVEISEDRLDELQDEMHIPENTPRIVSDGLEELKSKSSNARGSRGIGFYWMPQRVMCNLFPVRQDGTPDTETNEAGYGRLESCRSAAAMLKDAVQPKDRAEILSLYSNLRTQIDGLQTEAHDLKQEVDALQVSFAQALEQVDMARSAKDAAEKERKAAQADAARAQAQIDRMLAATRHPSSVLVDPRNLNRVNSATPAATAFRLPGFDP